jgi:glycosyltransferase involved in cell wall biosynthesis
MPEKDVAQYGISVVCPTYNCSNYIQRTIDSLLNQTDLSEEVIFSDDGSRDDTVYIIEKNRARFEKSGIRLHIGRNVHQGPGATRNHGVFKACQPWIAFLDADDTWKPEKLKRIRQAMKKFLKANCFLHWEEYVRSNGLHILLQHGNRYDPNQSLYIQLYKSNFFSTSAIVCKRTILMEVDGFDPSLPNAQDYDLWLKMSQLMQLHIVPEVLGSYIEEPNSITARPYYNRFQSELRIAWRHRRKGEVLLLIFKIFRIFLSKQWFFSMLNLVQGNKYHNN